MKKNKYLVKAENVSKLSQMAEASYIIGGIDKEEYKGVQSKIKEAEKDNLFAAMAAFCKK